MCRFVAYLGPDILLDELLYQPNNSLIHQSYHALERADPVNGDGFGVGFYVPDLDPEPALFVTIQPAWNYRNLRHNAPKMKSGCILAHVRAASSATVSEVNCHPFQYGELLLMHNGKVAGFKRMKRRIRERLSEETYQWISGGTDTEHFFALMVDRLIENRRNHVEADDIVMALRGAITDVMGLRDELEIEEDTYLNLCISNGRCLVATRFCSDRHKEPHTLYFSEGSRYTCESGVARMVQADPEERAVIIASERLSQEEGAFTPIPPNHFVTVQEDRAVEVFPI